MHRMCPQQTVPMLQKLAPQQHCSSSNFTCDSRLVRGSEDSIKCVLQEDAITHFVTPEPFVPATGLICTRTATHITATRFTSGLSAKQINLTWILELSTARLQRARRTCRCTPPAGKPEGKLVHHNLSTPIAVSRQNARRSERNTLT